MKPPRHRLRTLRRVTLATLIVLLHHPLIAQSALAPSLGTRSTELPLFIREVDATVQPGRGTRIVRYGQRGTQEEPGSLDLPEVGRAFTVYAYDLLVPGRHIVEARILPDYQSWVTLETDGWVVMTGADSIELVQGGIRWHADHGGEMPLSITAGEYRITGSGTMHLQRQNHGSGTLSIAAERGRFEVFRGEELVSVPAAGQQRQFPLDNPETAQGEEDQLQAFLHQLERGTLELFRAPLTGDRLVQLQRAVLHFLPVYARSETVGSVPGHGNVPPDVLLRYLGDGLRMLSVATSHISP